MTRTTFSAAAAAALSLLGCAGFSSGPTFSGISEARLVNAERVGRAERIPVGFQRLGRVSAHCARVSDVDELEGEPLSNVDCSRDRLERALAERAALAGGELLVNLRCREPGTSIRCDAMVARPSDETLSRRGLSARAQEASAPAPGPLEVQRLDEPHASHSWEIFVSFERKPGAPERQPRTAVAVTRTGELSAQQLPLGDAQARCETSQCTQRELEHALRLTAARAGADSLAGVRCFESDDNYACVATLGALPVEADRHVNRVE